MKGGRRTRFKHDKLKGWLHDFQFKIIDTKENIITATSKSGMHIRATKKMTQFGSRFIRINDDIAKLKC